ncbi:head protein [Mycobacterium phage Antsirabe]|uniref:Uncharacterized protein n=1 Tax=Mycobacterium phage Antsirabe TaxID=2575610 RepID=A0A5J6THU8_9CAUD|nr:head protein [Mycobacterium phage Antsirabe]QFG09978.1 hypothetical protein PBI_ANTSIRABE_24 [Mycobacterium phage Antsirabe]
MSVGPTAYLVNKLLDHTFRNVPWTPPTVVYFKGHVGDPGAVAANNPAAVTTRIAVSFSAAANGLILLSGTPELTLNATENISHGSLWDAAGPAGGNPLWTAAASVVKGGAAGDIIRLTSMQFGFTGLAA